MKKSKKITRIAFSIILALLVGGVIFSFLGVTVAGRCAQYVNEYNDFYLYKKETYIKPFINFGTGGAPGYKIWFFPGQKSKMLKKIKEDVNFELENIVKNYSDVFRNYEISDDFINIYIYIYIGVERPVGLNLTETLAPKVELYHQIINGYGNSSFSSNIMDYIEVE